MKRMFLCVALLLGLLVPADVAIAQSQPQLPATRFFFVLLLRPPNAPQLSQEALEKLQDEHMANIRKMHFEHKLAIAGPFVEDTPLRGIFVFMADSMAQAQEWTNGDPAVKAGRLAEEVHGPWMIDPSGLSEPLPNIEELEQYTLVFLKSDEKWNPGAPGFMDVVKQQPAFFKKMTDQGNLAMAGLFPLNEPGELRGVAVFRVGSEQTAKLAQDDPTVKAGLLKAELHPWLTGKGVLASGQPMK
jgi:uncharacterized protein YciI